MSKPNRIRLASDDAAATEAHSQAFVAELAKMPTTVLTLLRAHRSNGAGLCLACTRPGYGTAYLPWPCALWRLAARAERLIEEPRRARRRNSRTRATAVVA